jgi:uracil phosphoribosyltransferase
MDPSLNERAYIMPGLGDAGDRITAGTRTRIRGTC